VVDPGHGKGFVRQFIRSLEESRGKAMVVDLGGQSFPVAGDLLTKNYTAVMCCERTQNHILSTYHYKRWLYTVVGMIGFF